jgi:6-pyruvoyltetrahydropterin/6-carboxytetrahydropterin synthase
MNKTPVAYRFTSTKEYVDAFPCAYRQWRADDKPNGKPGCGFLHGYSFSIKLYFGTDELDARNWAADYGSLRPLKDFLEDLFDHTTLVASDDPELEFYKEMERRKLAKLTILPRLGCESLADMLYCYINAVFIPEQWGSGEAARLWCYRVEVRETQANMAFREGHREWNEDLMEGF